MAKKHSEPYDQWLTDPPPGDTFEDYTPPFSRASSILTCKDERFLLAKKDFAQQYFPLYAARLRQLRAGLQKHAQELWPKSVFRERILELREGEESIVVGTLYKDMPLKPSILDEYGQRRGLPPGAAAGPGALVSGDDALLLEDEASRVRLLLEPSQLAALVTGLVVAVRASELPGGDLRVHELVTLPPRPPPPLSPLPAGRRFLALVSGLQLGSRARPCHPLLLELLVGFLRGRVGPAALAADVVRLIVLGDSVAEPEPAETGITGPSGGGRVGGPGAGAGPGATGLRQLDGVLAELAASLPLTLLPGRTDPANFALPQQPLNGCLLPLTAAHASVALVPNPHECEVDGVRVLCHAGQPLADLEKYVAPRSRLDLLNDTARWAHLAPTTPDTLGCYPFAGHDPFVLEQLPHVLAAGCQPAFASRLLPAPDPRHGPTRLVCVPAFHVVPSLVLLELGSLDCLTVDLVAYA